jgi:hypothetical protein
MQPSHWDRQELHERVWQVPMRKLAVEYGISDAGLAKVCRKLQIPLPGLGHWTKIQCGHQIPRPPLPAVEGLRPVLRPTPKEKIAMLPEDEAKLRDAERVAGSLTPPGTKEMLVHPLVERTRQILSEAREGDRGMLWGGRHVDWLDVRVSKGSLPRALRLMAALLHLLENEGFKAVVEKQNNLESTSVVIYGQKIRFGLVEKSRQIKVAETPGKYTYPRVRFEPKGILSLEIWSWWRGGLRKGWRDGICTKLEEVLPSCLAGMMKIALAQRARHDAQEKKERARQKQVEEATQELRAIEKEEKRIKELRRDAVLWRRAQRIRDYVVAVRLKASDLADETKKTELLEWATWAGLQADRLDPLQEPPHSIVDGKQQVLRRLRTVE